MSLISARSISPDSTFKLSVYSFFYLNYPPPPPPQEKLDFSVILTRFFPLRKNLAVEISQHFPFYKNREAIR